MCVVENFGPLSSAYCEIYAQVYDLCSIGNKIVLSVYAIYIKISLETDNSRVWKTRSLAWLLRQYSNPPYVKQMHIVGHVYNSSKLTIKSISLISCGNLCLCKFPDSTRFRNESHHMDEKNYLSDSLLQLHSEPPLHRLGHAGHRVLDKERCSTQFSRSVKAMISRVWSVTIAQKNSPLLYIYCKMTCD